MTHNFQALDSLLTRIYSQNCVQNLKLEKNGSRRGWEIHLQEIGHELG
jgi:hypothetical protein